MRGDAAVNAGTVAGAGVRCMCVWGGAGAGVRCMCVCLGGYRRRGRDARALVSEGEARGGGGEGREGRASLSHHPVSMLAPAMLLLVRVWRGQARPGESPLGNLRPGAHTSHGG
eukprot:353826-Chlamydomonas_euryale.AAC.1